MFGSEFLHFSLVHDLSVLECNLLWLDLPDDLVVLLKSDDPFAETFGCLRSLSNSCRFKLRILEELFLDLVHDEHIDVVFIIVLKLGQEVFLVHKFLSSVPPIFFKRLRVVFLGRFLDFSVAHYTDCVQNCLHCRWWVVQDSNFIDVGWLNGIKCIISLFENRECFLKIVLTVNLDFFSLHGDSVGCLFLLLDQAFLRLHLSVSSVLKLNHKLLGVFFLFSKLWFSDFNFFLHASNRFLLLHKLFDTRLVVDRFLIQETSLLVEQGLEHIHHVQKAGWGHVIVSSCFTQEGSAQLYSFCVENLTS